MIAVNHTSDSPEWLTPDREVELVHEVFGEVDLDPASCPEANERIKAKQIYTEHDDGLTKHWSGRVYVNAPGEERGELVKQFWKKAVEHAARGEAHVIWMGFNVNQLYTLQCFRDNPIRFPTCLVRKRIQFISRYPQYYPEDYKDPKKRGKLKKSQPAHHNFITILSRDSEMVNKFREVFSQIGVVIG